MIEEVRQYWARWSLRESINFFVIFLYEKITRLSGSSLTSGQLKLNEPTWDRRQKDRC